MFIKVTNYDGRFTRLIAINSISSIRSVTDMDSKGTGCVVISGDNAYNVTESFEAIEFLLGIKGVNEHT